MRAFALPLLRRNPREIARRAGRFAIRTEAGRSLVARLGEAFIGGYNAMLTLPGLDGVAAAGRRIAPHERPFFFEGAAMGYLPRGYFSRGLRAQSSERNLLAIDPAFRYLYYVGLGFWYGMRHPFRPSALERLVPHLDPLYSPLCYDGYGFKVGFFDFARRPGAVRRLALAPEKVAPAIYQGFGRALFFVFMDDPRGFEEVKRSLPSRAEDLEQGRALALGFTGIDRPGLLLDHLAGAAGEGELAARLTGLTWALTAREMNDPAYFESCLSSLPGRERGRLRRLPALCRDALGVSKSYFEWQGRTRTLALEGWTGSVGQSGNG